MKSRIWYDDDHGIIRCLITGPFNTGDVKKAILELMALLESSGTRLVLVNTNDAERMIPPCRERSEISEWLKKVKWEKAAVVGTDSFVRLSAKLILSAFTKLKTVQFFSNEKGALYWLKDGAAQKAKPGIPAMQEQTKKADPYC